MLNAIEQKLRAISLPSSVRPPIGPHEEPTEELVRWAITLHVYSQIAHIRTVLSGVSALSAIGNTPSAKVLSRHIFEWTAHACYMECKLRGLVVQRKWKLAFDLLLRANTANAWMKNHGKTYERAVEEEIPNPIPINYLIAAYAKFQKKRYGKSTVHDSYGFLSEYAHPNSACFVQYQELEGNRLYLRDPAAESSLGGIRGFLIEWLLFMHGLLGLAREETVRVRITEILTFVASESTGA